MVKRSRMKRARKPLEMHEDGKFSRYVDSEEEFEKLVRGIDRSKNKVMLL